MTDTSRRLNPKLIVENIQAFQSLETIPDYRPGRSQASREHLQYAYEAMPRSRAEETRMDVQMMASGDRAQHAELTFHAVVLAMKQTVLGQFGANSLEIQAMGYKRKSARRRQRPNHDQTS